MSTLATPTLSLSQNTLIVSNIDDNATKISLKRYGNTYKDLFIINDTYTNVTASSHVGLIASDETVTISLSADGENYILPQSISITGATGAYTRTSDTVGTLVLSNPTNKVIFTVQGAPAIITYSITPTLTNVTADASNPTTISTGETKTLYYYPTDGYNLPDSVTVSGATGTWTVSTQYQLSGTATNVTLSSDSAWVDSAGSYTFTVTADGTSYKLPTKITVADTEVTAGTSTTIANKCTVLFTRTSDTSGTIAFSNVTDDVAFSVVGEAIASYPAKGDIITIESKRYRVLDISGSHAKLFGLFDAVTTAFDTAGSSNVYAGSTLDTALNITWFGQQSSTFQNAVDDSSITTSTYQYSDSEPASWTYEYDYNWTPSDPEYATRTATTSAITRKVYALDLKDYYDYKGTNTTTSNDLMKFFFEGDGSQGSYSGKFCWLRSADADISDLAWRVNGDVGDVDYGIVDDGSAARPALTIDLSKIDWQPQPTIIHELRLDLNGGYYSGEESQNVNDGGSYTFDGTFTKPGYILSTSITVEGTEVITGESTTIPNKCDVLYTLIDDTNATIAFSNVAGDVDTVIQWDEEPI